MIFTYFKHIITVFLKNASIYYYDIIENVLNLECFDNLRKPCDLALAY